MNEHDIVIAGGGIAGLYCARRLAAAGHRVLILETASDRWGGRIETEDLDGFIAEMGPMRFEPTLQPRFAAAHNNLGLALERRGLREDAIRSYRESIRLDDTSRTRTNLGRVFVNARQFEDAQPELERALQIDPRNADAERLLTLARQATGRQ